MANKIDTTGLLLYLDFNNTINDISGNGNNGFNEQGGLTYVSSQTGFGTCGDLSSDGNSLFEIPNNYSSSNMSNESSFSVWFKSSGLHNLVIRTGNPDNPSETRNQPAGWITSYTDGLNTGAPFSIFFVDNKIYAQRWSQKGNKLKEYTIINDNNYIDGQWHHAVITFSVNNGMKFYIDGSLIGTNVNKTPNRSRTTNNTPLYIGTDGSSVLGLGNGATDPYVPFVGHIDEITLWERELTSSEVSTLADALTGPLVS
jgi:hypothetical protein